MAFLNGISKVSILVSDVATATEMEQEICAPKLHCKRCNNDLEGWRKQFKNLKEEKELLFNEMKKEKDFMISNLTDENEEI